MTMNKAMRLIVSGVISGVPIIAAAFALGFTIDWRLLALMFVTTTSSNLADKIMGVE